MSTRKQKTPEENVHDLIGTKEGQDKLEKQLKKIAKEVKVIERPLDEPKHKIPPLKTHTVLDEILGGGGLEAGKLAMLYGAFASGKTQTLFTMAVEAEGLVYFIDTEGTFSRKRIKQIAKERGKDPEEVNKRIKLIEPKNWMEQFACLYEIPSPMDLGDKKISLIVIDSLLAYVASTTDFSGRQTLTARQQLLKNHLRKLRALAKMHHAVAVFTTQVYTEPVVTAPNMPKWTLEHPQGGNAVLHIPDFIIHYRKQPTTNIRIARLKDSSEIPLGEVVFCINEKGIDNIPESAEEQKAVKRARKRIEEKGKEFRIGMEDQPPEDVIVEEKVEKKKGEKE